MTSCEACGARVARLAWRGREPELVDLVAGESDASQSQAGVRLEGAWDVLPGRVEVSAVEELDVTVVAVDEFDDLSLEGLRGVPAQRHHGHAQVVEPGDDLCDQGRLLDHDHGQDLLGREEITPVRLREYR